MPYIDQEEVPRGGARAEDSPHYRDGVLSTMSKKAADSGRQRRRGYLRGWKAIGQEIAGIAAMYFAAAFLASSVWALILKVAGWPITGEDFGFLLLFWSVVAGAGTIFFILMEVYGIFGARRYLAEIDEIRRQRQERLQETEDRRES